MSFKEFVANILSTRDYEETRLNGAAIADINAYLTEINASAGREKGFSLVIMENGEEIFRDLEGVGGYSGIMIKSPHYIGLVISEDKAEAEFFGAYFMQSVVKKLYDMNLGSCWINIRDLSNDLNMKLLKNHSGTINYLLAFGIADKKAIKHKSPHISVTNTSSAYKQDPYGIQINEASSYDRVRHSLGEIVYLNEWGRQATYEELEGRGVAEILFYVRNAPSYKNLQPCRLILKDGEMEIAVINPENRENYIDAGIMMYTLQGLVNNMGIQGKWHFVKDESANKDYRVVAKIEL